MRQLIYAVLMSVTLFVGQAQATNFYVRTDGNDACNGTADSVGSSGNCAKRTIQAGVNLAFAGDTVRIHAGNYTSPSPTFTSARSGSSGSLITIQAFPGETISLSRITLTHNYNVVQGFRVTNSGSWGTSGIQLNGDFNQALGNTILGVCSGNGSCLGMDIGGDRNTVSNNTWDGQSNGANTSFAVGIHIEGSNNEIGPGNLIKDMNSIERVFEPYGVANHIFNNEVRNFNNTVSGPHPDIFQTFGTNTSRDHIIENNYVHDIDGQLGNLECQNVSRNCDVDNPNMRDWIIRNNIFANITAEFFFYYHLNFYNNLFYRVTTGNTCTPLNYSSYGGSMTARNNAFIACGCSTSTGWYTGSSGGGEADYNFVAHTATGGAKSGFSEPNGRNGGNPLLKTPLSNCTSATCDFHILSGSALTNFGTTMAGFSVDKDNIARPQGTSWDIGAYEFISGGDITPPVAPTNVTVR